MQFKFGMFRIFITAIIIRNIAGIKWLGLGKLNRSPDQELEGFTQTECDDARNRQVLQSRHHRFCIHHKHRFAMHAVFMASKVAPFYCMKTFSDRRWNCKSAEKLPKLSEELKIGTQEQAIVHAFGSAALLFEISRRCSQSKLRHCPCGRDNTESKVVRDSQSSTYYYANCPDNVEMGLDYAKRFLGYDRMGRKRKGKLLKATNYSKTPKQRKIFLKRVNGHNYAAGLEIMRRSWKSKCKCHGVSGSCTNEICFRQLRRLDDDVLLKTLKDHYLAAKYVTSSKDDTLFTEQNMALRISDLAFMEHSPDYCEPDRKVGSVGTQGRQCETYNVTEASTNHCSNMCCGRGYRKVIDQETVRCKCSLDQHLVVTCKLCTQITENKFCL